MGIRYQTKPLTLPEEIQALWETAAQLEELVQLQQQEINNLRARVKRLERKNTTDEADTQELY